MNFPSLQRHRFIILSVLVLIFGGAWIFASAIPAAQRTQGNIPAPQTGFLAPDFTLANAAGEMVTLSDLRGQAVIINLWASWCGPCRTEMPAIQQVYDEFREEGFTVLAVNATSQDSQTAALRFAEEYDLTFPILFDVDGSVIRDYQVRAFPSTFFVGRDGVIQEVVIGGPMAEALLTTRAQNLLEETP